MLLEVLHRLVDLGNTVVVIEHNLHVIKTADWIVDLGPEGGARGGTIVAAGTPETVAMEDASHTGHYLRPLLPALGAGRGARGATAGAPQQAPEGAPAATGGRGAAKGTAKGTAAAADQPPVKPRGRRKVS